MRESTQIKRELRELGLARIGIGTERSHGELVMREVKDEIFASLVLTSSLTRPVCPHNYILAIDPSLGIG